MFSPLTVGRGNPSSPENTAGPGVVRQTVAVAGVGALWHSGWEGSPLCSSLLRPETVAQAEQYRPDKIIGRKQPAELRLLGFILHINVVPAPFRLFNAVLYSGSSKFFTNSQ